MELYIQEKSFGDMIGKNNEPIEISKRQELVRILVDFIIEHFGSKPSTFEKKSIAKAATIVFPRLMFKNSQSDGTVSIVYTSFEVLLHFSF